LPLVKADAFMKGLGDDAIARRDTGDETLTNVARGRNNVSRPSASPRIAPGETSP
jgi:hypothetical protein